MGVLETAPKLIAAEREAAIKALHEEMTPTINFLREEGVAGLAGVAKERAAALKELREAVTSERQALTQDTEQISLRVVDHAFWRAAQFLAAVLAVLAIGLVLFFKRPRTQNL